PPTIDLLDLSEGKGTETIPDEQLLVRISFNLKIGKLIDSDIMQVLPIPFAKELVDDLFLQNSHSATEEHVSVQEQMEADVTNHTQPTQFNSETNQSLKHNEQNDQKELRQQQNQSSIQTASFAEFENVPV